MTQSKHTPAPWHISDNPKAPYLIYGSNDYAVADCKVYHGKTDISADMHLIAAAPDLLHAAEMALIDLVNTVNFDEGDLETRQNVELLENAINKAKGIGK